MAIHLIGSNGFLGKAIRKIALERDDIYFYSSRKNQSEKKIIFFNLNDPKSWLNLNINKGDKLIFLSWKGLNNYNNKIHLDENLIESLNFFKMIMQTRISKIIVAGTCYEYGLQSGCLSEHLDTKPHTLYAYSKDTLRRILFSLCEENKIKLAWLRIFYPYGIDQNPKSLIPSLERSIANGESFFNTSPGDQIRDFISIENVAKSFLKIADSEKATGIINIGSGEPISVKNFLKKYIKTKKSDIKLNLGFYPYREDEPKEFWADTTKLKLILDY